MNLKSFKGPIPPLNKWFLNFSAGKPVNRISSGEFTISLLLWKIKNYGEPFEKLIKGKHYEGYEWRLNLKSPI